MAIIDKLNTIKSIKSDIKGALEAKGATPNDDFSTYATEIQNLSTGGGDTTDPDIIQLYGTTLAYTNKITGKKYNIITDYYNNTSLSNFLSNCTGAFTLSDFLINNKPEYGLLQLSGASTIYGPNSTLNVFSMSCYHLYNTNTKDNYDVNLKSNFKDEVLDKKLFADNTYKNISITGFVQNIKSSSVVNKLLNNIDWSKVYSINQFFQYCGNYSSASDDEANLVIENDINLNLTGISTTSYIAYFPSFKTIDMTKFKIKYYNVQNYNNTSFMSSNIYVVYYDNDLTTFKTPTIDFSCLSPYSYKYWNSWDKNKPSYIPSSGGYDIQAGPTGIKSYTFTFFDNCSKLTNIKYNVIGPIKVNIKLGSCSSSMDMLSFSDVINALYNWKVNPDNYMSSHKIIMSTTLQNKLKQTQKDAIAERGWILATS